MRNRRITLMDTRSGALSFTGLTGVHKSGYSDVFRDMMRKLRHTSERLTFAEVFKDTAARSGYGSCSIKRYPLCGTYSLKKQCCCLHCGMIATYQGGGAEISLSAETVLHHQPVAAATAVGSAQRGGMEAPATPPRTTAEEELEDEVSKLERKENMLGRLLEYGVSHLSSMRASMAKTIWKSIKARLAWRASPFRSSDDHTAEGHGLHSLERIRNYAFHGYTLFG